MFDKSGNPQRFMPSRAFVEEAALEYPLTKALSERRREHGIPAQVLKRGQRPSIPGSNPSQIYLEAKRTLVVRVRKQGKFEPCKPSAHYQLPLVTSCPGLCEYCYLQTRLGPRPYIRVYANVESILTEAARAVEGRKPEITVFEGAATADPLAVEWLTGSLKTAIEFIGHLEHGRFRFVTKYSDVGPILGARHQGKTTVRFSLNAEYVLKAFEHRTAGLNSRIRALKEVVGAGYPVGIMIGPIIIFEGWRSQYESLLEKLGSALAGSVPQEVIPFELITHRFTMRAKANIQDVFPNSRLPMDESERRLVYGQFGYAKHVYPKEVIRDIQGFFESAIPKHVNGGFVQYLV